MAFDLTGIPDKPDAVGDFDLSEIPDEENLRLSDTLRQAVKKLPEQAANERKLSERTGLAPVVVERNYNEVEQRAKVNKLSTLAKDSPAIGRLLTNQAEEVHDDVESYIKLEKAVKETSWFGVLGKKTMNIPYRLAESVGGNIQHLGEIKEIDRGQIMDALSKVELETQPDDSLMLKLITTTGKTAAENRLFEALYKGQVGPEVAEMIKQKQYGSAYTALREKTHEVKSPIAEAVEKVITETGERTAEYWAEKAAEGQPIVEPRGAKFYVGEAIEGVGSTMLPGLAAAYATKGTSIPQSLVSFAVMGTNVFGRSYAESRAGGMEASDAQSKGIFDSITEAGSEMIPLGILTRGGGKWYYRPVKAGAAEAIQEMSNEAMQMGYDYGVLNKDTPPEQMLVRLMDAGIIGAIGGAGLGIASAPFFKDVEADAITKAAQPASEFSKDAVKAQTALDNADGMNDVVEKAKEIKSRVHSPEALKTFLDDVVGAENEVIIPAEDADTFFQSHPELLEAMPEEVVEAVQESLATKGDVAIQTSDYITYLSDFHDELSDSLRNDMDGMNVREANEWVETGSEEFEMEAERILAEMEEDNEIRDSADRVAENIETQLVATKRFNKDIAKKYSQLHKAFAVTVADKLKVTPEQVYEQFGLRVTGAPIISKDEAIEALYQAQPGRAAPTEEEIEQYITEARERHRTEEISFLERGRAIEAGEILYQAEPDQDLFVAHNLSAENILAAEDLGGLAAPSLAVARAGVSDFTGFGEVTLLADPSLLQDPKTRAFDADVYSPRQPRATYDIDQGIYSELYVQLDPDDLGLSKPDIDSVEDTNGADNLLRSSAVEYHWLQQQGKAPKIKKAKIEPIIRKAEKLGLDEFDMIEDEKFIKLVTEHYQGKLDALTEDGFDVRAEKMTDWWFEDDGSVKRDLLRDMAAGVRRFRNTGGKDVHQLRDDISKKMRVKKNRTEYEQWVTEQFNKMVTGKTLFKGFTPAGRRKYIPYNMQNVVKEMTQQLQAGESFFYGAGTVRSKYANEMKTIKQIQAKRDEIVSEADMEKVKEESSEVFIDALEALKPFYKFEADSWGYGDDAGNAIVEGRKGLNEAFNMTPEAQQIVDDLLEYLVALPTSYFEAKVQRAVGFEEFDTAVVPRGMRKDALQVLKDAGLKIKIYDPKTEGARAEVITKQQQILFQETRGQIQFPEDGAIITLLENADLSTFLHESAHFFFESYKTLAAQNPEIAQDMQALLDFIDVDNLETWNGMTLEQRREGHEKVARAFESYLFEGKAPNIEIQSLFSRFRDWLLSIYKNLRSLNVELTDEVRQVFDRMLATKEQIREREVARSYEPLFESAEEAGMTEKQWQAYQNANERQTVIAESELQTRSLRDMKWLTNAKGKALRQLQKEAKAKRKAMRSEVAEEVSRETIYSTIKFLKTGEAVVAGEEVKEDIHKLDINTVREMYEGVKRNRNVVQPEVDSLNIAIAKLGGIDTVEAEAQGIDPAEFSGRAATSQWNQPIFGKRVFKKEGLSFDAMAEALSQYGYISTEYTANELLIKLQKELAGIPVYSIQAEFDKISGAFEYVEWEKLGKGKTGMLAENGTSPSIIGQTFGFASGDEMIQGILAAEPKKERIERLTDQRMLEAYGDLTDPVALERAAEQAIHNEAHTRFIHTELTNLTKRTATGNVLSRAAKLYAEQAIARKKVREIRPFQYSVSEARAAKNAQKAIIQGDRESAAEHKRAQVLNNHFFRAANNAQNEIEKMLRFLKRGQKPAARKKMRGEYLAQRDALLERFDLRKAVTLKELDERQSLSEFVQSEAERLTAVEIAIDPHIADERVRKHYKEMTVEELRGLFETVKQLDHLSRREHKMYIERRNMSFQEEENQILNELRSVHEKAFDEEGNPIPYRKDTKPLIKELYGKFESKFDAEFINVENLLEIMTLGKGEQIFDSLFGRLSEAADDQSALMKEISDFLNPYTKAYSAKERLEFSLVKSRVYVREVQEYFTRERRIAVAMNYGNPEGRQRLIDGNGYTEQQIQAILRTLEQRDVDFINAFWEMSETMIWPRLKAVDERTKGLPAKKVAAIPFDIPAGKLTGGYVPLVYDGDLDTRAYDYHTDDAISDLRGGSTTRASTRQSASKERLAEVKRPINLSLGAISYKINETIHDVTHREAVTDTYRLMQGKKFGDAIRTIAGPAVYKSLLERVRETAVKPIVPQGFTERTLWYARRNTLINMMGLSFNTVAINVLGASPAIRQVGAGRFSKALSKLVSPRGREMYEWIMVKSPYMRERIRGYDRDLSMEANRFLGKGNIGPSMSTWLIGLSMMDRAVTLPTWLAAYEKGMEKFKNNEDSAVQFADRTIRQTQGSGRVIDLPKIAGGTGPAGEFKRIITMYYNFFSAQLGQMVVSQRISGREWTEGKRAQAAKRMALTTLAVVVIPATLEAIARGQCEGDEPEDVFYCMGKSSALFMGQFFPIFRDMVPTIWKQFDPETQAFGVRISPVESAMETVAKTPKALVDVTTGDFTESDISTLLKGAGYLAPGPGFQANRTLRGYQAFMDGETDNPMVILTGPPR